MGVYINMEMPKPKLTDRVTVYNAYILVSPDGHAAIVVDNEDGLDSTEYPLVPVPEHGDLIDRNETIKALWKALFEYEDRTEKQFVESSELDVADWILHRIFVQNMSDIDRQTILQMPTIIPAEEDEP